MKAKLKEEIASFKPVTIEVTFETEREMRDFKSAFNHVTICDFFNNVNLNYDQIYDAIPAQRWTNDEWADFVSRADAG